MERQLELAYLGLGVPDPAALASTFTDAVGLVRRRPLGRKQRAHSPGATTTVLSG